MDKKNPFFGSTGRCIPFPRPDCRKAGISKLTGTALASHIIMDY